MKPIIFLLFFSSFTFVTVTGKEFAERRKEKQKRTTQGALLLIWYNITKYADSKIWRNIGWQSTTHAARR